MNCLKCGEPVPQCYTLQPDEAELEDRVSALECALQEITDGCDEPSIRAKQALGYADVPPDDERYEGEPLDPDDPCSSRARLVDGERWTTMIPHDLGASYALGDISRLLSVYCKRCGRMWSVTEVKTELPS